MPHPSRNRRTKSDRRRFNPVLAAAVTSIAAAYGYALIFTRFALLQLTHDSSGDEHLHLAVILFGGGGVIGCAAASFWFTAAQGRICAACGFLGCVAAAVLTQMTSGWLAIAPALVLAGCSVGWTTVSLSLCLRPSIRSKRLGRWCGLGVGLAYAISNQPSLSEATPWQQVVVATVLAAVGCFAALQVRSEPAKLSVSKDYTPQGTSFWVVLLLSLACLDASSFYIIQQNPTLVERSWESAMTLQGHSFLHICLGVLAGIALDRRIAPPTVALGAFMLALAGWLLSLRGNYYFPHARVLYVAGVSIYTTALLYLTARSGNPRIAGLFFSVVGFAGFSLGTAVVLGLSQIPIWFFSIAVGIVPVVFGLRYLWLRRLAAIEAAK